MTGTALSRRDTGVRTVLSETLEALIETPEIWIDGEHGGEPKALSWHPPALVSAALRAEAKAALTAAKAALEPPARATVGKWLAGLGMLAAGKTDAATASAKLAAYARFLDHPAACFTEASLKAAARRFKWFPSFAEIAQFLDEEARPWRDRHSRLDRLACAEADEPKTEAPRVTPAEIAAILKAAGMETAGDRAKEAAKRAGKGPNADQLASAALDKDKRTAYWLEKMGEMA